MKRIVIVAIVLGMAVLAAPSARAQSDGPKVITPDSVAYGRTFGEWSAAWNQWADSIPTAQHPLFDNGDCSVGQSGPVWFLGGKFCALNTTCGTTGVHRFCTLPAGKALFFPVLDVENSTLESPALSQIADLRSNVESAIDAATNLSCEVDGAAIPHLKERFRVQSSAFGFTLPSDNFFTAVGEGPFNAGTYFPAVDDGVYVMLAPLPHGQHVIHFGGAFTIYNFTLDVTYYLTVLK